LTLVTHWATAEECAVFAPGIASGDGSGTKGYQTLSCNLSTGRGKDHGPALTRFYRNESVANPDNYALACMPPNSCIDCHFGLSLAAGRALPTQYDRELWRSQDSCLVRLVLSALHACNSSYLALVTSSLAGGTWRGDEEALDTSRAL
jgi:hypothetical protein